MIPAWRMAPPICCLIRHASWMKSREPASTAPTGAPALGEVDPDRIERRRVVGGRDAARDHGVHQARAIHVAGEPVLPGDGGHRRIARAATAPPPSCSCSRPPEGASAEHGGKAGRIAARTCSAVNMPRARPGSGAS